MKSVFVILIIYLGIFLYGNSLPNPFAGEKEEDDKLVFKNNSLPIYRNDGRKLAQIDCQELITNYRSFTANNLRMHIYAIPEKEDKSIEEKSLNQKFKSPGEDIYLDADLAEFINTNEPISFKKNVKMTYGKTTYLETEICQWTQKSETIFFPEALTLQSGNNLIKGETATFETKNKNVQIEKNIVSFFELAEHKSNKYSTKNENLTKLTSVGPLIYNNSHRSIKMPNSTTIKNLEFTLSADKIEFYLNDDNKIYLLKAEGNVKIILIEKNVVAWSPTVTVDFEDKNYHFMGKNSQFPFIEMNGYRQTAEYITYNDETEILKAGPEVKSVKIIHDSKE